MASDALFLALFRRSFLRPQINAFNLYPGQFATMSNRAVIALTPPVLERDDFFILPLLDHFGGYLCSGDERVAVRHVIAVGKQQYITECRGLASINIQKVHVDRVTFRDSKLSASSSDNCVSHRFLGRKKPPKIPQIGRFGKPKA